MLNFLFEIFVLAFIFIIVLIFTGPIVGCTKNINNETKIVKYCIDTPDNFTVCCDEYKKGESIPRLTKCDSLLAKEYLNPTNIRVEEK